MDPLVPPDEAAALVESGSVIPADVRWYLDGRSGREAYEAGHLPGAVFVDLDTMLAAPPLTNGGGRHPLPPPEAFSDAMGSLGIGDDSTVLAYDDAGGSIAARLWWMLRATGHAVAVLDGGIAAWPRELETGVGTRRPPATFTPSPWPGSRVADADFTGALASGGAGVVLDARAPERYRGEVEPIDPRAGHIPGAKSAPWSANLDHDTGRFLLPGPLRHYYRSLGVEQGTNVIAYCGSGITSCHTILALERAGLGDAARLYAGSWSDWSADADRPVATGNGAGEAPG